MAREGAHVVVNYHQSKDAADELCEEIKDLGVRAISVGADVTQADQVDYLVEKTLEEFCQIDILIPPSPSILDHEVYSSSFIFLFC